MDLLRQSSADQGKISCGGCLDLIIGTGDAIVASQVNIRKENRWTAWQSNENHDDIWWESIGFLGMPYQKKPKTNPWFGDHPFLQSTAQSRFGNDYTFQKGCWHSSAQALSNWVDHVNSLRWKSNKYIYIYMYIYIYICLTLSYSWTLVVIIVVNNHQHILISYS